MNPNPEKTCHCSSVVPVILQGSLQESSLNCMQCKNPVSLEDTNVSDKLADAIKKWGQLYSSLFTLWHGSVEYREWAKQKLLDDIGSINLEGLKLAQQYNRVRKTYYWMFQNNSDKNYVQPQHCPYCGESMVPILENDFKVCHSCMIAYPNRQTS